MSKTPDEIKKGLEICNSSMDCNDCPYLSNRFCIPSCKCSRNADALAYIRQLEERNKSLQENNDKLLALDGELHRDYLEQRERADRLEAERDAAVEDIYEMAKCIEEDGNYSVCVWCDQTECERLCMMHLIEKPGFKWRGVQKEDGNA